MCILRVRKLALEYQILLSFDQPLGDIFLIKLNKSQNLDKKMQVIVTPVLVVYELQTLDCLLFDGV